MSRALNSRGVDQGGGTEVQRWAIMYVLNVDHMFLPKWHQELSYMFKICMLNLFAKCLDLYDAPHQQDCPAVCVKFFCLKWHNVLLRRGTSNFAVISTSSCLSVKKSMALKVQISSCILGEKPTIRMIKPL